MRLGGVAVALALAAASAGVVIPSLRGLAGGGFAAGVLAAAHVLGGALGASMGPRLARRLGVRRMVELALIASAVITGALALVPGAAAMLVGRTLDGVFHVIGVTTLVAAAVEGDPETRARRAGGLGLVLVLGVAAGLGVGGGLTPGAALVTASALAASAAMIAWFAIPPGVRPGAPVARGRVAGPPALLAGGERFVFGLLSVALPFALGSRRTGMALGILMTASVIAMPFARSLASRWGAHRLAGRAATVFALALLSVSTGVLDGVALPVWAAVAGAAAGALYAASLALVAAHDALDRRLAAMGAMHAAGSAGHAAGALAGGVLVALAAPLTAIALVGAGVVALTVIGVAAPRDRPCPARHGRRPPRRLRRARRCRRPG